jgi:hypothetical protein
LAQGPAGPAANVAQQCKGRPGPPRSSASCQGDRPLAAWSERSWAPRCCAVRASQGLFRLIQF